MCVFGVGGGGAGGGERMYLSIAQIFVVVIVWFFDCVFKLN